MARPRIFVSSTFYDLRHVRHDIERFVREFGYDPILHERGHIAYGNLEELENDCYNEISRCDILVAIVGPRFGSASKHEPHSIAQMELKTALELGKQVYIFVDRHVDSEYNTFLRNKEDNSIRYAAVDDVRVYEFIEHIRSLPHNNVITPFDSIDQIYAFLREQWAGLFQRFLQENALSRDLAIVNEMKATSKTLSDLVNFLVRERHDEDKAFREIVFANNPIFHHLKRITNTPYRVYFLTRDEMNEWLGARQWKFQEEWEDGELSYQSWIHSTNQRDTTLTINMIVFDEDGKLRSFTPAEWKDNYVQSNVEEKVLRRKSSLADELDDEIPF